MEKYLVVIFLSWFPFMIILYAIVEFLQEKKIKKHGIKVVGKVVNAIPSKVSSQQYFGRFTVESTNEVNGGFLLEFEYEVKDEIWTGRTRQMLANDLEELEVIYNPSDPSDIMVNGFYKVGNIKYFRLICGLVLFAISMLPLFFSEE